MPESSSNTKSVTEAIYKHTLPIKTIKRCGPPNPKTTSLQEINYTNIQYYTALWAKQSSKKHKIWTDDGYIEIKGKTATLRDNFGKYLGSSQIKTLDEIESGMRLSMGSNEAELIDHLSCKPQYQSTALKSIHTDEFEENPRKLKKARTNFCFTPNLHLGRINTVCPVLDNENKHTGTETDNEISSKIKRKAATPASFSPVLCLGTTPAMRPAGKVSQRPDIHFDNTKHVT